MIKRKILSDRNSDDHAKKEMKMDKLFVDNIIKKEGYCSMQNTDSVGSVDVDILRHKFSCHYAIEKFFEVPENKRHLVTGFGPTNAPTGGTLSVILRALFFQRETNIDSTIIISNLGAFNSRNVDIQKIDYLTQRFKKFIRKLGYKGELRTHADADLLIASSLTSKVLTVKDFIENEEKTTDLYQKLNLLGKDFPMFVDANYTVADILLPFILKKKERVLVFVGIEEHYFPKLANLVLDRFNNIYNGVFVSKDSFVSAIFGCLIEGLNGYPKMSKSIPFSSINLDNSEKELENKIIKCSKENERIILQMINLVSDWNPKKIREANLAYQEGAEKWIQIKKEYLEYFLNIKKAWEDTRDDNYAFKTSSLFKKI